MPADAGITIHESRLFRTFGAPAIVASIRNPRYRALCSYLLAREFAHASMAHSRLPSGTFIVNTRPLPAARSYNIQNGSGIITKKETPCIAE